MRRASLGRFGNLAAALLLAAFAAAAIARPALAQEPPSDEVELINADDEFVERKRGGEFVARPIFDRPVEALFYAVRDADTGDWITAMYRVIGGESARGSGWEYAWDYPRLDGQPDLDPDRAYLLVMLVRETAASDPQTFYTIIPIHMGGSIWDRVLAALDPARWARALAGWVIEGTHGTLCGIVERASGEEADNCAGS